VNAYDLIQNVVNQYIVRPTGNPNLIGVGGFVFDILGPENVIMDSEITDHYVEDGSAIQDHIVLRPIKFTLRGYVAELNDILPNYGLSVLKNIQSIGTVGGLLPNLSTQATQAYAKLASSAAKVTNVINQGLNIYDIFTNHSTASSKQQKAFKFFQDLQASKTLVSVETPWRIFENMAIESIHPLQNEDTKYVTQFDVNFKQIRTVEQNLIPTTEQTRATDAMSEAVNRGKTSGNPLDGNKNVTVDIIKVAYAN
jgi:hypothetical protein